MGVVYDAIEVNGGIRLESQAYIRKECAMNHINTFVVHGFYFSCVGIYVVFEDEKHRIHECLTGRLYFPERGSC